jgi:hypothetical protein
MLAMLFGKRTRRAPEPIARRVATAPDAQRGVRDIANGPDTPVMDVAAMRRALDHAAWRDTSVQRRKNDDAIKAVRTLERTAACVDLAGERLAEAAETLSQGKSSRDQVMRGLLTARFEALLDSLERVAIMAQDGNVNLLAGIGNPLANQSSRYAPLRHENSLSLDIGTAGFSYVLTPIDIRRGTQGLAIPVLESGFESDAETYEIETALLRAQTKLAQFSARLSHDAAMLITIAKANDQEVSPEPSVEALPDDDAHADKTDEEVAA